MRHRKYTFKIGRTSSHRRAMVANQVCSLISNFKIITTVTKAKQSKRIADRMVTLAKNGSLHARRKAISVIKDIKAVRILFDKIGPMFLNRNGGYTSIHRLSKKRTGDSAEVCILRWISELDDATVNESKKN